MSALLKQVRELKKEATMMTSVVDDATIIGLVSVDGNLSKKLRFSKGKYRLYRGKLEPTAFFAEILEPLFTKPKRFNVLIGGRGSGKSIGGHDIGLIDMHDKGDNLMCIREYQSSIADSVHSLLSSEVKRLELSGADVTERAIRFPHNKSYAKFSGLSRNPESVKSAHGFKKWIIEEAQFLSDKSLRVLTPSARNAPMKGLPSSMKEIDSDEMDMSEVNMLFIANPASSEDPFSQRFIVPFQTELDSQGYYEDDMHLIIKMNYSDNPWFEMSGLEQERLFDKEHLHKSIYEWVWEGGFNDAIENALIEPEWFDACIDAHLKLKSIKKTGAVKVSHDPSDLGADPKALCVRVGNVITQVKQRKDLDVNDGVDWALEEAVSARADQFIYDLGGMGTGCKRQVNEGLKNTNTQVYEFLGQKAVERPDDKYMNTGSISSQNEKTNAEVIKNLRAQCYLRLRDRMHLTYRAIIHNEFIDPELMISISSECDDIKVLRSELCRMPIKPSLSGFEMYTKDEMRKKFKVRSPNCADAVMQTEVKFIISKRKKSAPPQKIKQWKRR